MLLQCNVMCNHFTQDNEKRRKNDTKQCEMKQTEAKRCNSPLKEKYAGWIHPCKRICLSTLLPC